LRNCAALVAAHAARGLDLLAARAPLTLFSWRYGHLLNFNGLTHTALLLWPLAASAWLFALSGRPAWGAPNAGLQ
jgi:hypothetical protein